MRGKSLHCSCSACIPSIAAKTCTQSCFLQAHRFSARDANEKSVHSARTKMLVHRCQVGRHSEFCAHLVELLFLLFRSHQCLHRPLTLNHFSFNGTRLTPNQKSPRVVANLPGCALVFIQIGQPINWVVFRVRHQLYVFNLTKSILSVRSFFLASLPMVRPCRAQIACGMISPNKTLKIVETIKPTKPSVKFDTTIYRNKP